MRKYICIILLVLFICAIFTACGPEIGSTLDSTSKRFEIVENLGTATNGLCNIYIVIDTQTNVEYLYMERDHRAAITVLLNSDGTPMLWYGE